MTTPSVMRDLDAALARAVELEVEAANWKIRALKAEERLELSQTTAKELIRMVDGLRTERDTWRAKAES